jgi:hypothetical protein
MKNPEKNPARGLFRTGIRIPLKQKKWLDDQAKKQHRNRNAQIVSVIEAQMMQQEERQNADAA